MFCYTVACEFGDPAVADAWVVWLNAEHLSAVCKAGAVDAEVVRIDPAKGTAEVVHCEVRYHFPSREAFVAYERDHAPRLRDEGLRRFPLERGLRYERSTGEVVGAFRPSSSA